MPYTGSVDWAFKCSASTLEYCDVSWKLTLTKLNYGIFSCQGAAWLCLVRENYVPGVLTNQTVFKECDVTILQLSFFARRN
jgi:hypothetical protein